MASRRGASPPPWDLSRYVAGVENAVVGRAIRALAADPRAMPSPVLLLGPAGTGKSHLLRGLHRDLHRTRPELTAYHLDADGLTNRVQCAARDRRREELVAELGALDLLLVDDLDRLHGRAASQRTLARVLDRLSDRGAAAVLAMRDPDRADLGARLRNRLAGGVPLRVDPATAETRNILIQRALLARGLALGPPQRRRLAAGSELRDLDRLVDVLAALQQRHGPLVAPHVDAALKAVGGAPRTPTTVAEVTALVESARHLAADTLRSRRGARQHAAARRLAMALARDLGLPRVHIAEHFEIAPDSVTAALRAFGKQLDDRARAEYDRLRAQLDVD